MAADSPEEKLDLVRRYIAMGWSLLPLRTAGKHPHHAILRREAGNDEWRRFQTRRATLDQFERWLQWDPSLNVGVVLGGVSGGLVCVDVDDAEAFPDELASLLPATATVTTGRGTHRYYRSSAQGRVLPWGELRAEGSYTVLPPSVHPSGAMYQWSNESAVAELPAAFVNALGVRPDPDEPAGGTSALSPQEIEELASRIERAPASPPRRPELPDDDWSYLASDGPENRSDREMSIIHRLVNQGWSDVEIAGFLQKHPRTKHAEEMQRGRGAGWVARSLLISRGRMSALPPPPPVSIRKDCTHRVKKGPDDPRWTRMEYPRRWIVLKLITGQTYGELVEQVMQQLQIKDRQAKSYIKWVRNYCKGTYVSVEKRGRSANYSLTDAAVQLIDRVENGKGIFRSPPMAFYDYLRQARPNAVGASDDHDDADDDSDDAEEGRGEDARASSRTRDGDSRRSSDRAAKRRAEARRRNREAILGYPLMHFAGRRRYILQFLSGEDFYRTLLHRQLRVGWDSDGLPIYESFISQQDVGLGGPTAHDPLMAHDPPAYPPRDQGIAAAILLDRDGNDLAPVHQTDGEAVPRIVVQSPRNFWSPLLAAMDDDITASAVEVVRTGQKQETRFSFRPFEQRWTGPVQHIDFAGMIEKLADPIRAQRAADAVPPGTTFYGD